MPCMGFATSALPPSAAMVRAVRQIDLAPSGNVSNSFSAALIHEMGRVFRVICRPLSAYHSYRYVVIFDNGLSSYEVRFIVDCQVWAVRIALSWLTALWSNGNSHSG